MYKEKLLGKKRAVIIVPTYNESQTIDFLIKDLCDRVFLTTEWECHILVVDANSPDGTPQIVQQAVDVRENVHLIVETKKEGLGSAYFKGFKYAIEELAADAVVEFDGDLQHPTDSVPKLLKALDNGADLVLGSRKVKGGSYPKGWDALRLFFSRVGGFLSRLLLFFPLKAFFSITDPTTGLKATRINDQFKALDFDHFTSKDFGYKLEMLFKLVQSGDKVAEIPLKFQTRQAGESKMTGQTPFEILKTCIVLRTKHKGTRRFVKFGLVGFSGYIVNSVLLEVFSLTPIARTLAVLFTPLSNLGPLALFSNPAGWAAILAVECSIINNFFWNNFWTFRKNKAATLGSFIRKFFGFNLTSMGAVLIQFITISLATSFWGNTTLVRQITLILSIGLLVMPFNWFLYNKIIWKKKHLTSSDDSI